MNFKNKSNVIEFQKHLIVKKKTGMKEHTVCDSNYINSEGKDVLNRIEKEHEEKFWKCAWLGY